MEPVIVIPIHTVGLEWAWGDTLTPELAGTSMVRALPPGSMLHSPLAAPQAGHHGSLALYTGIKNTHGQEEWGQARLMSHVSLPTTRAEARLQALHGWSVPTLTFLSTCLPLGLTVTL